MHGQKAKEVQFDEKTISVRVYMYGESRIPLQIIPDVQQNTHDNHFGEENKARPK